VLDNIIQNVTGILNRDPNIAAQKAAGAQQAYMAATIPGYEDLVKTQMQNIQSGLKGEVPMDVQNQLAQAGAERGVATGSRGPGAYLAALGRTSLDRQTQAGTDLSDWSKQNSVDPTQFMVTPAQEAEMQAKIGSIAADLMKAGMERDTAIQVAREQAQAEMARTQAQLENQRGIAQLESDTQKEIRAATDAATMERTTKELENRLVGLGMERDTAILVARENSKSSWNELQAKLSNDLELGNLDAATKLQQQVLSDTAAMERTVADNAARLQENGMTRENSLQIAREQIAAELEKTQAQIANQLKVATLDADTRKQLQTMQEAGELQRQINQINAQLETKKLDITAQRELEQMKLAAQKEIELLRIQSARTPTVTNTTTGWSYDAMTGKYLNTQTGQTSDTRPPNFNASVNGGLGKVVNTINTRYF
jgi:hypothetical protein